MNGRNVSVSFYENKHKRCICLAYFLTPRSGNAAYTTSISFKPIFWLVTEGLLHEKVAALSAFKFWISFTAGTYFIHTDSVIFIIHIILFQWDTVPSTSVFALAVCWSGKSILVILLVRFDNKKLEKINTSVPSGN